MQLSNAYHCHKVNYHIRKAAIMLCKYCDNHDGFYIVDSNIPLDVETRIVWYRG